MKRFVLYTMAFTFLLNQHVAFSQNKNLVDSLQIILKFANSDSIRASILNKLADSYFTFDNDKSLQYAQEAFALSEKTSNKTEIGNAFANMGRVYLNRDNYPEAFKNLRAAIKLKNETGNQKETVNCYIAMGHAYLGQGNIADALKNYFEAIKINEATGGTYSKDVLYQCIALVYSQEGNYSEALKYYYESLKTAEGFGKKSSMATIYLNLAGTYLNLKNYPKAEEYNLRSLKLTDELDDRQGTAYVFLQMGFVYKARSDYSKAFHYFFQSLKIAQDDGFKQLEIELSGDIGITFLIQKKYAKARSYLEKGLSVSKEIGSVNDISQCYANLAQLDSALGKSTKSLQEYKMHILYRDSAINLESVRKSEQVRMKFEMDKKEVTAKAEQDKRDTVAQKELQKQKFVRNAFMGGFIFVLVFAGVFFRQRNKISKARKRSDELLLNILPEEVADELKAKGSSEAKHFDEVTVMFTDFKGFTQITEKLTPSELVAEIDTCFKAFDNIITKHNIEKIKTIGDAYMCAGGLPVANKTHAEDVVKAALEIQKFMLEHLQQRKNEGKEIFEIRIGIHTGPVVAGIVGLKKFAYDIWGDTVNIASRMESSGEAGKVNISGSTYALIKDLPAVTLGPEQQQAGKFNCEYRGEIEAKGKGKVRMYFVNSIN